MCTGKGYEYQWREDDPDDRYTSFWNSIAADYAIQNAPHWNWDKHVKNMNKS